MSMNSTNAQNGKYAEVNGLHMYYEEYGKGSPLVLIHGAASTVQTSYGRLIPELSKTHRIIGVEMQAHGHSDNRDGRPISFEQDAADVVELLRQLHIEKADFLVLVTENNRTGDCDSSPDPGRQARICFFHVQAFWLRSCILAGIWKCAIRRYA